MCICYNIILLLSCSICWQTYRNKQGCVPGTKIFFLPSCCNIGKLAEINKGVYLLLHYRTFDLTAMFDKLAESNKNVYLFQHYPPSILLQCWQTCRNKLGYVPPSTLSSFHLSAMLANLQKQTRLCIYSNIIILPSFCNIGKLAETNKDVYLLQHYPPSNLATILANLQKHNKWYVSVHLHYPAYYLAAMLPNFQKPKKGCVPGSNIILLPSCSNVDKLRRNKQECLSVSTLSSFYLAVMLANVQKQTRMCVCSNIIFLPSC